MKEKDYTGYSAEQLLEDDFFMKSFFHPTDESQAFWQEQAHKDEVLAKEFVLFLTVNPLFLLRIKNFFGSVFPKQIIKNDYVNIGILLLLQYFYY